MNSRHRNTDREFGAWSCRYIGAPESKTAELCESHGGDHRAYGWSPKVDPRWTAEQKEAYWRGYLGEQA